MNEFWVIAGVACFAVSASLNYVAMKRVGELYKFKLPGRIGWGTRERERRYLAECKNRGWSPWLIYSYRILFALALLCLLRAMPAASDR